MKTIFTQLRGVGKDKVTAVCVAISLASIAFILFLLLERRGPDNLESSVERSRQIAKAIAYWSEVIQQNPKWAEAYCCRGDVYRRVSKCREATADYTKAIQLNPKLVRAYCGRADIRMQEAFGCPTGADRYDQAHDVASPLDFDEFDRAIDDYSEALRLDPNNAISLFGRARVHMLKREREEAIRDYSAGIRIDPSYARAYDFRGAMYEEKGEKEKANMDFITADRLRSGGSRYRLDFKVGESAADLFFRAAD